MSKNEFAGVYQLNNGYWGYRYAIVINGRRKENKRVRNEAGLPFKTQKQAARARNLAIAREQETANRSFVKKVERKTVEEIYKEYTEKGRAGKAFSTIQKQDSLWKNHIKQEFGDKYIDELTISEIQDYLEKLYYVEGRAYSYVESFLKMFYLIYGQAYNRGYIQAELYNDFCQNKISKIKMPKRKVNDEKDIAVFSEQEIKILDTYFKDSNAETAYMLGKYCGLRIAECYGITWVDINFDKGCLNINKQLQYQNGLYKLVPLKTRNAKREIEMPLKLKTFLIKKKQEVQKAEETLKEVREQNKIWITDDNNGKISSLELVNTLVNGKMQSIHSMKYHAKKIKESFNIHFKFHYLRHTYATNLAIMNMPNFLLCRLMGHSSIHITQKYYTGKTFKTSEMIKKLVNKL